ncbi:rod shape-determining protein MreC [Fructobacillus tropaeoli]|uniref:Cell shape-determining protein MreC n=1 Tax=Fructobacillus tropaeoli TaxID=709323 RepID=A0A3F3H172_9LACO|nr:rod shape-determining protein MreC [Fructobacillus tropaeoli]NLS38131.1 rod shape-determining protein MreC [Fructobacillus tropaeoli]CAK1231072.1 Cell shape-determining protein MreC (MreC) [Fructobacillus tropaeoli]CAK1231216.1 Cell shape-determining protein MreC (MreC) [Fructobacillus tropaeoli]CAK1232431.1 Cell shape-determining protein MreC (MreC) [Fructobacillus tropaeoli]CAK1254040.1 Cell shape-determining protein MreC (MreC) [Fructobacillus tropaeoli]
MRKLFSSKTAVILMVSVIVIVGLITGSNWWANKTNTPPFFQRAVNDITGGISRVIAVPTNAIGTRANSISNLMSTFDENQKLKAKLDGYAQNQVKMQTLEEENKSLKKQLGLKATLTDYETISAVTIARSPTTWQSQLVINKGAKSGLKKGMPVLGDSGLIGRISEVNTVNSKVTLISDTSEDTNRFAITVKGSQGDVNGIITDYDADQKLLIMGQVTESQTINPGDKVVTSGLGGSMPSGILIGKVAKVTTDDYGLSRKIYIQSSSDLSSLSTVLVARTEVGS